MGISWEDLEKIEQVKKEGRKVNFFSILILNSIYQTGISMIILTKISQAKSFFR
jgi:hypothetical protein